MRAFIAIEISEEQKAALGRIEERLRYAGADVKWVRPEIAHLTLKFLGEIDEKRAADVASKLDAAVASSGAFDLMLKDIGAFPSVDRARVIWVGLGMGAAKAAGLAARIDSALMDIGFAREERPFSQHLTIGRVRSGLNREALAEKIRSSSAEIPSASPHKVTAVILFRSTLTPQGPVYARIHESRLSG